MRWFVNDLSLKERFASSADFVELLTALAEKRGKSDAVRNHLYCSRDLINCRVTPDAGFHEVIALLSPPRRSVILSWMAKYGPFLEDDRLHDEEDYYEFEGYDVTDQGLGEASRRIRAETSSGVFSFASEGEPDFLRGELNVQHGLTEEVLGRYPVPNVWRPDDLEVQLTRNRPAPMSWTELEEVCNASFPNLWFCPETFASLRRLAFYPAACARSLVLLGIMNEYAGDLNPDGSRGEKAEELYEKYCVGDYRIFSDEADGNVKKFRSEMTFVDPDRPGESVFCPWHGKIKNQQFRIHFECPSAGSQRIRVFYIGPKITKR